jgi:heptosyltransferase II
VPKPRKGEPTKTSPRYLIVRIAAIGDAVMASTLLARIRREQPGATVTWMCGRIVEPLVRVLDGVDEVIEVDETRLFRRGTLSRAAELWRAWRALAASRRFDRVFLLHPDLRYRALLVPLIGVPVTCLSRQRYGAMNPIPGRYFGDEYARLLDGPSHVGPIRGRFSLATVSGLSSRASSGTVVLIPGGAKNVLRDSPLRRWPVESYVALATELRSSGFAVALVGGPDDAWVRPFFSGIVVEDRIGKLSLPETVAFLANATLVISHDTGPMHLARLARAPLIALFGPTMPTQFLGDEQSTIVLWGGAHLACRPCYDGREFARCSDNICISSIPVGAVMQAARQLLAGEASSRAGTQVPIAPTAAG